MHFDILSTSQKDFPWILDLNESNIPKVNAIGDQELAFFEETAAHFVKVEAAGKPAGVVIALTRGIQYKSVNYQWFSRQFDRFLYIDRIMVEPAFYRQGVATLIYQYLEQQAIANGLERLCCEVNIKPANPDSMALHQRLGFRQAATQDTERGSKQVSLLVKEDLVKKVIELD